MLSNASQASAYEVYGIRALAAANTGAELALQRVFFPIDPNTPLFDKDGTPDEPEVEEIPLDSPTFLQAMFNCEVEVEIQQFRLLTAVCSMIICTIGSVALPVVIQQGF